MSLIFSPLHGSQNEQLYAGSSQLDLYGFGGKDPILVLYYGYHKLLLCYNLMQMSRFYCKKPMILLAMVVLLHLSTANT